MKKVTLSLDEDLASWLRVEAAKVDKSISRFVADALAGYRRDRPMTQREGLDLFLSGPEMPGLGDTLRNRDDFYDEVLLSRYKSLDLPARPQKPGKAASG